MAQQLDTSTLGPIKIDPARPSMLEGEIIAQIVSAQVDARGFDPERVARRILKIDRISRALKLLDNIDSGHIELLVQRSWPESSDAR